MLTVFTDPIEVLSLICLELIDIHRMDVDIYWRCGMYNGKLCGEGRATRVCCCFGVACVHCFIPYIVVWKLSKV